MWTRAGSLCFYIAAMSLSVGCGGTSIGEVKRFRHQGEVVSIAFLPDGQRFVSAERADDGARLWNIATGKVEAEFARNASAVAVSRDGSTIAMGTLTGRVLLWDVDNKRELRSWIVDEGSVVALAFSPDGRLIAVAQGPRWINSTTSDGQPEYVVWIHDVNLGDLVESIEHLSSPSNSIVFIDHDCLCFSTWSQAIFMWTLSQKKPRWQSGLTEFHYGGFEFDQPRVAISQDRRLLFWRNKVYVTVDGAPEVSLKVQGDRNLINGCFLDNNRHLLTSDTQGDMTIWNLRTGKPIWRQKASKNGAAVTALALSPDGKSFLTGCFNPIGGFIAMQRKVPASDPYVRLWKLPDLPE